MNKKSFIEYISTSDFINLFVTELGWNVAKGQTDLPSIEIDSITYNMTAIAERNGFHILTCAVKKIPTTTMCRKIDIKLRKQANDYICIYYIPDTIHHQWVAPVVNASKRDIVTIEYEKETQLDFLYSKLGLMSFDLDEKTTIVDVKERVQNAFAINSEKITKDFYSGFQKEHKAFAGFISGIDDEVEIKENRNKQWYTSVMLNRLMFCYFIQKKGFLDNDVNYLQHKLARVKKLQGEDKFFKSFYRGFLTMLFHDGLNTPKHNDEFEDKYGRIPYLNGGMFDEHQLEKDYEGIDIADEAFERLFDFFDKWEWHLDTRLTASGKDINPDVLGYIFEQYINDRAQMGAYYTKEDITEYIGKNCIIPYLMDRVKEQSPDEFKTNGYVWEYLKSSGDRYIYDAVKKGYSEDWSEQIPANIAQGLDTSKPDLLERRKDWNTVTSEVFALPTEIWRETIERLQRCEDILNKIRGGKIAEINDFITYNLDIRSFVYDLLNATDDHKFILHFYKNLQKVTILDPTCGSGAFLFAAMNILEPLYEVCISRMQEFNQQNKNLFKEELGEITHKYRSNIRYYIFKNIILRNLYGVDIMVEATEIAKLRLFLKMVAEVEVDVRADNLGLDPLPDIDFNIRCGNTLVGYATEEELVRDLNVQNEMLANISNKAYKNKLEEELKKVATAYDIFKKVQFSQSEDMRAFKQAKNDLKSRLAQLNNLLNKKLHGVTTTMDYDKWYTLYQPFHWLAEFYQIIVGNGGFDVIIGNPPYVGYTRKNKITKKAVIDYYHIRDNYKTLHTSNLYAFTIERSYFIMHKRSKIGMIIPITAFSNTNMAELQTMFKNDFGTSWISTYHQRPAQLFEGVLQRLSIFITNRNEKDKTIYTTGIYRWFSSTRHLLFHNLSYVSISQNKQPHMVKIGSSIEKSIFEKYSTHHKIQESLTVVSVPNNTIYYRSAGGGYWVTFLNNEFDCYAQSNKEASFIKTKNSKCFSAALNSNLFWWYYSINYDLFNFTEYMIFSFQMDYPKNADVIVNYSDDLESNLRKNAIFYDINSRTRGVNTTVTYKKQLSKSIMDNIDIAMSSNYGFTEEELDFIINYDIKYRMGDELEN